MRWYLIGAAAIVVIAVAIALFFRSRRAQALTEKDSILLTEFTNTTGDPVFDGTLKQAVAVQLDQSPVLNVFPESKVRETLGFMGRSVDERVAGPLAKELCQRAGVKAMLAGSIAALGSHYAITLDATNCANGDSLAREQAEVESKEQVLKTLGKAVSSMRGRLGDSLASVQKFDKPLDQATTSSLEALHAYSRGEAERNKDNELASIPYFKKAIELDPNFALAYARLGVVYGNMTEFSLENSYKTRAFEMRDRVSERERLYITSHYYSGVTGELDKELEAWELYKQTYPRDSVPLTNLAVAYWQAGIYQKQLDNSLPCIPLEPTSWFCYSHAANAYRSMNRLEEASTILKRAIANGLEGSGVRTQLYLLAVVENDEQTIRQQLDWARSKGTDGGLLLAFEGARSISRGLVKQGRELQARVAGTELHAGEKDSASLFLTLAARDAADVGDANEAVTKAHEALKLGRSEGTLFNAGIALAYAGRFEEAENLANEMAKSHPLNTRVNTSDVPAIRALVQMGKGNADKAVELLKPRTPYMWAYDIVSVARGKAYLLAKKPAEASQEFQNVLTMRHAYPTSPRIAVAMLGLGRAYAMQGDPAKARTSYQNFFAYWKDADPDVPLLKQAKTEYAKLP